jgi:CxxC motif-containing protein
MIKRELTCIGCPLGCMLQVELENDEVRNVTGYTCARGKEYAVKEVTNPTRIVTTTVRVTNGSLPVVSVKTSTDIPKDKIRDCISALKGVTVTAPVQIGDVILENIAGMNSNVIATKNIRAK